MKTYAGVLWILCSLCIICISAGAQEKASKALPSVLAGLEARLKPIVATAQYEEVERLPAHRGLFFSLLPKSSIPKVDKIVSTPNSESPNALQRWPLEMGWRFDDIIYIEITEGSNRFYSKPFFGVQVPAVWRPEKTLFLQRYDLVPSPEIDKILTESKRRRMSAEIVNTERDNWAYQAFTYLSTAGFTPGYTAEYFDGKKPLTRLDAALVLATMFRSTLPLNFPADKVGPNDERSRTVLLGGQDRNTHAQMLNDAVDALTREFRDEVGLLGISTDSLELRVGGITTEFGHPSRNNVSDYIRLSLSYGPKADVNLVEQIKKVVASYVAEKTELDKATNKEN